MTGAASPRVEDTVATPSGDIPARLPAEVIVEDIPKELRRLEIELVDDLVIRLPGGEHNLEITVRSPAESHWFGVLGGHVRSLTVVDTFVGGAYATTEGGDLVLLAMPTKADSVSLMCEDNDGLMVGWIEAAEVTATECGTLHLVSFPMMLPAEVRTGRFEVGSSRIIVGSTLFAGSLSDDARITCESSECRVVIGDIVEESTTKGLTMKGGQLSVVHGELTGLSMLDVDLLHVGREVSSDDGSENGSMSAALEAMSTHLGYGLVTGARGHTRELRLEHRAIVAGDPRAGFAAERVVATPSSEISGIDARSFNLYSAGVLRDIRRLGLWVNPSTHSARRHFEREVQDASSQPDPAQFELAHRRKQLLALAIDTQQDGHTLSVLREAEKDARRASLPAASRERILLELWRWLLGYGERIGYPLVVGTTLIVALGIGYVGWARFWSSAWWGGWGLDRAESIMNFALPGVGFLGIDGIGGFWGISAKIVSVIFLASAATAAIRVVKRGE